MYYYDMRSPTDPARFGDRVASARTFSKTKVLGIESKRNEILVGYSDATVKAGFNIIIDR